VYLSNWKIKCIASEMIWYSPIMQYFGVAVQMAEIGFLVAKV
jgi:hypothetical protein